jgi:hypothetical protein
MDDNGQYSLIFSVRKSTTASYFSVDAIETAAEIALWENIPPGYKINYEKPITKRWWDSVIPKIYSGTDIVHDMVFVNIVAYLLPEEGTVE